eukprot:GHVO01017166.1.p1 GENE.GHVO01017166.1~~GHVO01017166.1.p1  ORF type:complete len:163 (+),score=2.72 GHVO01017166.1:91-579(+)
MVTMWSCTLAFLVLVCVGCLSASPVNQEDAAKWQQILQVGERIADAIESLKQVQHSGDIVDRPTTAATRTTSAEPPTNASSVPGVGDIVATTTTTSTTTTTNKAASAGLVADPPTNCREVQNSGGSENGVYTIYTNKSSDRKPIQVYCDMQTDGGGWLVSHC